MLNLFLILFVSLGSLQAKEKKVDWKLYTGKTGPTGWKVHVLHPDPKDHGPDGINVHDWDGDGDNDVFANYEEGKYSRLYFNPGKSVRELWTDYIEFKHSKCEDSGIGDLDGDGDIDYIANGGQVYFNPGKDLVKDQSKWELMVLFKKEERTPTVSDIDGDGLNDLVVGGKRWYKQPVNGKHKSENWQVFILGKSIWTMSTIIYDVDKDGDNDIVVQDRHKETFWYVNPGKGKLYKPWQRKTIYNKNNESMFMEIADANGDEIDDFIITGGRVGEKKQQIIILLRKNKSGDPEFQEIVLDQAVGPLGKEKDYFPKGVRLFEIDGDTQKKEILIMPKKGDMWYATYEGDSMKAENWKSVLIPTPGSRTRHKMDNVYTGDLDGDGDIDILTTEENSGWGVLWFENPVK